MTDNVGYFILCAHIAKIIMYTVYIFNIAYVHKNIVIFNTGYWFYIICCHNILFYYIILVY